MGEVTRTFRLHVPQHYEVDVAVPLVADFHGWGGDGQYQERSSHFTGRASCILSSPERKRICGLIAKKKLLWFIDLRSGALKCDGQLGTKLFFY